METQTDEIQVPLEFHKKPAEIDLDQLERDSEVTNEGNIKISGKSLEETGTELLAAIGGSKTLTSKDDLQG